MGDVMNQEVSNLESLIGACPIDDSVRKDIEVRFTYHSPKGEQPEIYKTIRNLAKIYALAICEFTPKSREQSLALTHLEEVVFWANASIARS